MLDRIIVRMLAYFAKERKPLPEAFKVEKKQGKP
jgi:hypothetical protein